MKYDEAQRLEAAVRSADPVGCAVDLIDSPEAAAVTFVVERQRRAMAASPVEEAPDSLVPLRQSRSSRVWAFAAALALVLVVIGAASLVLRGDDLQIATHADPEPLPEMAPGGGDVLWTSSMIPEPWVPSIIDLVALGDGGFVVAAKDGWSLLWSADGIEWIDIDPQREVTVLPLQPGWFGSWPQVIAGLGDRVAVLDENLLGIMIGDLETASWKSIEFEVADLEGEVGLLAVASNETDLLVIGYEDNYGDAEPAECGEAQSVLGSRYLAWLVEPRSGEVQRVTLPVGPEHDANGWAGERGMAGARICGESYTSLAWFRGGWVLDLEGAMLLSADGTTWEVAPAQIRPGPATLLAGPDVLLAQVWNSLWYSDTGTEWAEVVEPDESIVPNRREPADAAAFSDTFGYVATPWSDPGLFVSSDGREWELATTEAPEVVRMAASGNRALGYDPESRAAYLFVYSGSAASD